MNKGLMGLRGYANGGGVGDPGDDWLEELILQLRERWINTKGLSDPRMQDLPFSDIAELDPSMLRFWGPDASIEDLIGLSNLDITYGDPSDMAPTRIGPAPLPHAVPPLSDTPTLWEELRGMGINTDDLIEELTPVEELSQFALDQPVHDLAEAFADEEYRLQSRVTGEESIDDLIRGVGGLPPTEGVHFPPHDSRLARWNPLPATFYFGEGWGDKRGIYMDHPIKQRIVEEVRLADNLSRLGFKYTPKWGSIVAPLLAAAVSPAALAAETAFDFAISPEPLGGTASEVPGAGRTWRESPHIDPPDEEVASFMSSLLPYTQHQLARPSTGSQRALEQLIRRAQAGTPVNRYRR